MKKLTPEEATQQLVSKVADLLSFAQKNKVDVFLIAGTEESNTFKVAIRGRASDIASKLASSFTKDEATKDIVFKAAKQLAMERFESIMDAINETPEEKEEPVTTEE